MESRKKIIDRIDKMGLKKKFIAEKCDIGIAMFSLYLKGERNLRPEQENNLKKLLGLA